MDWVGAVARLEEALRTLRAKGPIDEQRAAQTLEYLHNKAAGRNYSGRRECAAIEFLGASGLSIDYVIRGKGEPFLDMDEG